VICKIWKLKILSILSYCKQLWRFLVKFLIKNIFLTISFVSRKGICDRIFFFQNTFLQNGENSSKNNSLAREHFSLSVTKSGCTCHPLLFSESHVYNWSHLLEQCVETWRLFQKKFINFWQFFWGRKVKRGQNLFFLKNNSPNGETLPKKEKLGQIRKRERERERTHPKGQIFMHIKSQNYKHFCPLLNSRSICWIGDLKSLTINMVSCVFFKFFPKQLVTIFNLDWLEPCYKLTGGTYLFIFEFIRFGGDCQFFIFWLQWAILISPSQPKKKE
jgi:hypothetical protein